MRTLSGDGAANNRCLSRELTLVLSQLEQTNYWFGVGEPEGGRPRSEPVRVGTTGSVAVCRGGRSRAMGRDDG